jgi:hypothetical protein
MNGSTCGTWKRLLSVFSFLDNITVYAGHEHSDYVVA